jgi:hypothetical protein
VLFLALRARNQCNLCFKNSEGNTTKSLPNETHSNHSSKRKKNRGYQIDRNKTIIIGPKKKKKPDFPGAEREPVVSAREFIIDLREEIGLRERRWEVPNHHLGPLQPVLHRFGCKISQFLLLSLCCFHFLYKVHFGKEFGNFKDCLSVHVWDREMVPAGLGLCFCLYIYIYKIKIREGFFLVYVTLTEFLADEFWRVFPNKI